MSAYRETERVNEADAGKNLPETICIREADTDDAARYMRKLSEDAEYRRSIAENGKRRAEELFSESRIQNRIQERYRHIRGIK